MYYLMTGWNIFIFLSNLDTSSLFFVMSCCYINIFFKSYMEFNSYSVAAGGPTVFFISALLLKVGLTLTGFRAVYHVVPMILD